MAYRYYIPLHKTPGAGGAMLNELDGHAEIGVTDAGTPSMLEWLDRLLDGSKEDGSPLKAKDLVVSDRDRLLAAIYRQLFGSRIERTEVCPQCRQPFDFHFSLDDLVSHLYGQNEPATIEAQAGGVYRLPDGACFRLPTGADELAVATLPAGRREQGLLERCIVKGEVREDAANIEAAMVEAGPLLETLLVTRCAECGTGQQVHFDIQSLLFHRLAKERNEVIRQVHLLAITYKWKRDEILRLGRGERRTYCSLILNERR
jgi:hypothetical protein